MNNRKPLFVIDDDESVRKALKRLIRSSGFRVETFNSGQAFFDSVPPNTEGIVILDIRMPDMDGFEMQEKLNQMNSSLEVIFITAFVKEGDREMAMTQGAKGFLLKPFNDQSLLDLIEEAEKDEE